MEKYLEIRLAKKLNRMGLKTDQVLYGENLLRCDKKQWRIFLKELL